MESLRAFLGASTLPDSPLTGWSIILRSQPSEKYHRGSISHLCECSWILFQFPKKRTNFQFSKTLKNSFAAFGWKPFFTTKRVILMRVIRPIVSACSCPIEHIFSYLDIVTAPIVKTLPFYIKDSQHALWIFRDFNFLGRNKLIFIVDAMSLYIFIPKDGGLRTLKHFSDQRTVKEPSSETLPWHIVSPCVPLSLIKCTKCIYTSILLFKIQFYIYVVTFGFISASFLLGEVMFIITSIYQKELSWCFTISIRNLFKLV